MEAEVQSFTDRVSAIDSQLDTLSHETRQLSDHVDNKFAHVETRLDALSEKLLKAINSLHKDSRTELSTPVPDTSLTTSSNVASDSKPAMTDHGAALPSFTPSIRPTAPSPFSGSERPRIDPRDHLFSLSLWLAQIPEPAKLN